MRYAFVAEHRDQFGVRSMCRCLRIQPSGFYAWQKSPLSTRAQEDARQTELIRQAWNDSGKVYGYRKLHDDLLDQGEAHGVPFVRSSYGFTGQWGPEKVVFTGTGDPVIYPCSEDGTPYFDRAKIDALGSLAAVNAYLDEADFAVPPIVITDGSDDATAIVPPVAHAQAVHVPPPLEIARMLVLSTMHMSPATAANWMPHCPWTCYDKDDYGWFMHVCDDVGITEAEGVPAEIRSAIHVAKRENCAWIMWWDCDGPLVDELPEYEWGDAPRTSL